MNKQTPQLLTVACLTLTSGVGFTAEAAVQGRYVRLEIPLGLHLGDTKIGSTLCLHEVEVVSGDRNVARQGKAFHSPGSRGSADQAIDGNYKNFTHSRVRGPNPWVEIDLGQTYAVEKIKMYPRTYPFHGGLITILDGERKVVWYQRYPRSSGKEEVVPVAFAGRYVGLQLPRDRTGWYNVSAEEQHERSLKVTALDIPPVPDAAKRLAVFKERESDAAVEQLCRRFHAAVAADAKGLERFESLYQQGHYGQALEAYRDFFFDKLANPEAHGIPLDFFEGRRVMKLDGEQLSTASLVASEAMNNRRIIIQRNAVVVIAGEVGPPGAARWAPEDPAPGEAVSEQILDFFRKREHQHGPRFFMFDSLLLSYVATGNQQHLTRWMDYLDDWCLFGRRDVFNSPLNLTMGSELVTQEFARQFSNWRFFLQARPEFARDFRGTTLARHLLASIEDIPPYLIRARRAELANWGCMGTEDLAYLSVFFPEFRAMRSFARESIRLAMSSYLQHRTLDGENIEAWDNGHRNADAGMMAVFDLLPQMPISHPKADAMQMGYLRDLKSAFYRHVLVHTSPGGYYRPRWLPDKSQRNTWRAMNYPDVRNQLISRYFENDTFRFLTETEPQAAARAAVVLDTQDASAPRRKSDIEPYAALCFLRDDWKPGTEYFILRSFPDRSQASAIRPVDNKNMLSGAGSMRYDLMKEGRSLLSSEGIVIDKKPSNRWHASVQTGGKTRYCAMAGRNVVPTRFHTSAQFDLAEAMRNDPYSRPPNTRPTDWYGIWERQPDIDNTQIEGVTAFRQVFHVRGESIWIVADRIENPHPKTFDYAQFWTYSALVNEEGYRETIERLSKAGHRLIEEDAQNRRIRTANPGYANVSSYFFGHDFEMVQEIDLQGKYRKTADAKPQIEIIRQKGDERPVFTRSLRKSGIRWNGQGNQALVTLHYTREPIKGAARQFESDVREVEALDGKDGLTGFQAKKNTGVRFGFQSGPQQRNTLSVDPVRVEGESLLVVEKEGTLSGMALGTAKEITIRGKTHKTDTTDFEYALTADGTFSATPIHRPIDTVVISPAQNVFTDSVQVSFDIPTQETGGLEFRYTLDGSDPTLESKRYTDPFSITQDTYVKVRPFRKGLTDTPFSIPSEEAGKTVGAIFRKEAMRPALQGAAMAPGLSYEYYGGPWPKLFTCIGIDGMLEPSSKGTASTLLNADDVQALRHTDKAYGIRYDGFVEIPATGVYSFYAPEHLYTPTMDAGYDLRVWVDGEEWFPSPTLHSENVWNVPLEKGLHRLRVTYVDYRWKQFKDEYWMTWQEEQMWQGVPVLAVSGPGFKRQSIPATWLQRSEASRQ